MLNFLSKDIGIDLGTANTLIYVKGKGIVLREPSVVACSKYDRKILAVGYDAKEMIGKTPDSIRAIYPLKEGVISDFQMTYAMIKIFFQKVLKASAFTKPRVVACVPAGVTGVERRAVEDAIMQSGAKEVFIVEESLAAAIGAGLPVMEPKGSMILDIGGGTSECAVVSLGAVVTSQTIRIAGNTFDEYIMEYVKQKHNLIIGDKTAEDIKIKLGTVSNLVGANERLEIKGRDNISSLPRSIEITSSEIVEALSEPIDNIIDALKLTLEETPPELAGDIVTGGITISGGGAMLKGLDVVLSERTSLPVYIANEPLDCVVKGAGMLLEEIDTLKMVQNAARRRFY